MGKKCLLICMVIFAVFLAGCTEKPSNQPTDAINLDPSIYETVNNFDGVTMTIKQETVSPTNLTVVIKNDSNSECTFGEYFDLEKKINGKWYKVPVTIDGDYGFNDIGYSLYSGEEREWAVDWNWLYGSLEPGEYRIIKDILDFRGTGDYDAYYLAAEFNISKEK